MYYAQWTLKTAIGNLGHEIQQDQDMFVNLTLWAVIQAQINLLCAQFPQVWFEYNDGSSRTHLMCKIYFYI